MKKNLPVLCITALCSAAIMQGAVVINNGDLEIRDDGTNFGDLFMDGDYFQRYFDGVSTRTNGFAILYEHDAIVANPNKTFFMGFRDKHEFYWQSNYQAFLDTTGSVTSLMKLNADGSLVLYSQSDANDTIVFDPDGSTITFSKSGNSVSFLNDGGVLSTGVGDVTIDGKLTVADDIEIKNDLSIDNTPLDATDQPIVATQPGAFSILGGRADETSQRTGAMFRMGDMTIGADQSSGGGSYFQWFSELDFADGGSKIIYLYLGEWPFALWGYFDVTLTSDTWNAAGRGAITKRFPIAYKTWSQASPGSLHKFAEESSQVLAATGGIATMATIGEIEMFGTQVRVPIYFNNGGRGFGGLYVEGMFSRAYNDNDYPYATIDDYTDPIILDNAIEMEDLRVDGSITLADGTVISDTDDLLSAVLVSSGGANLITQDSSNNTDWGINNSTIGQATSTTMWGEGNTVAGFRSTAWGFETKATGVLSTAWGRSAEAITSISTAWGYFTKASGSTSTAWGSGTFAESYLSTALGRNNVVGFDASNNGSHVWLDLDPLFEIGIGTSAADRANAVTVIKNGQTTLENKYWFDAVDTNDNGVIDSDEDPTTVPVDPDTVIAGDQSSAGEALVVNGHARFNGAIYMEPQGDLSMGAYDGVP
ncbi:hypothetical protein [Rubellicoccus peritrichatus]|uniref:Uncharacterized protein n=1 Tax=Rubellicoccus peritrichatus TaxID=3080537 RepID=A0AAQ3QSL6_9BACT|nr:hypothetical protein [Puniceicoccus sp. CR14]WOO42623.1 hypothetical protein RZN69_05930 [Puniceicoccus sp. CR14]